MYVFPEELRKAYESMPSAFVYVQYIDGTVVPLLVSDGFCRLVGMERDMFMSWYREHIFDMIHPDDVVRVEKTGMEFADHRGDFDLVFRARHEDRYRVIHSVGSWQTMHDGTELALMTYMDISDNFREMTEGKDESSLFRTDEFYTDPLTGLPNLNYLNQLADRRIDLIRAEGKTPVLIYADVISMQFYNSQYGYQKGNELLCLIAERLKADFPGALVMRGADDHFVLIDAFESREQTESRVASADRAIHQSAEGKTTGIRTGACVYEEGLTVADLLDRARNAVKWTGNDLNRICTFYTRTVDEQYRREQYILENFEKALHNGWIRVYYQGIIRTETGKGTAEEALARWDDPERGLLPPDVFIPVLEKYHLLHKLDLYMTEQVSMELLERRAHGLPIIPVTVNFSAQDFDYTDVPARVNEIYSRYCSNLPDDRKYLIIEITEQDMALSKEDFHSQLKVLRRLGFDIWMDDFGCGYSSLNVFGRFEVDLIKFDMDLLRHLDENKGANRRVMNAMVQIARELGVHTLAEGLETPEQKDFLGQIGCELAQGYLFHRPEPLEATLERLEKDQTPRPVETPAERDELNRRWFEECEHSLSVVEQFGNHMPGGFFISRVNENGDLLYANDTVIRIFGCKDHDEFRELTGFTLRGMICPEDYGKVFSAIRRQIGSRRKESGYMEYRIVRKDGEVRWVDEYSYYVNSDSHDGIYYVFISDITEKRMKAESDKALKSAVIEALTRIYDSVWLITDMKEQRFELYRIDSELAHMMPASQAIRITRFGDALRFYSNLVVEEDRERFLEATTPESIVKNTENKIMYSVPFRRIFEDGIRYYRVEFARLDLENGEASIVAGFKNVDEEVRKDQHMREALREAIVLSETDLMTGICNRMTGESRVSDLLENGRRGMFVLFDIDNFKTFNDRFGHNVGDQVIKAVADSLKNTFRGGDVVMRLGGDEFAAFASGVEDRKMGEMLMMRFYDNLSNAVIREGMEKIKVSAGAAFTRGDIADDFMRLYESADRGMYESKKAHDGRLTFI